MIKYFQTIAKRGIIMSADSEQKKIYIVLSQTGSIVAKLIKLFTRKEFSHASISLTKDLEWMYSFGRRHPYNPVWGGFVRESPSFGTMKRFSDSNIAVLEVEVTPEKLEGIRNTVTQMLINQHRYKYNYIGLFKAGVKLYHPKREYYYYCSEFVREILVMNNIAGAETLPELIHPVHFLNLPYNIIYRGKLCEYTG